MDIEPVLSPFACRNRILGGDEFGLLKKDKTDRIFESDAYEAPFEMIDSLVLGMIEMLVNVEHLLLASSPAHRADSALFHFEEH